MRYFALLLAMGTVGCAQPSQLVEPQHVSHIHTRVVYTAVHPISGELEIRNNGGRAVSFADSIFAFSADRHPIRRSLSSAESDAGGMLQYEEHRLRPNATARLPILSNAERSKYVGIYFFVNGSGDAEIVWSDNTQK
jgi:hypothetical protein